MTHKRVHWVAALALTVLFGVPAANAQQADSDTPIAPGSYAGKPMMYGQPGNMPMMYGQQGRMPMMYGQEGGMPMMYGRQSGMPMYDQRDARAVPGCPYGNMPSMHNQMGANRAYMAQMEEHLANIEASLKKAK